MGKWRHEPRFGPVDVSPNPVTERVDRLAQAIAERVVNLVLEAIDLDRLLERVDVNALVERIDVNAVVQRVDLNEVLEHVDIDALVDKLDIDALVAHTELGSIIAKSTTSVITEVLDVIRAQGVGLDDFFARWTNRILRRSPDSLPVGPPILLSQADPVGPSVGSPVVGSAMAGPRIDGSSVGDGQSGAISAPASR
jgi:hypothetical protein